MLFGGNPAFVYSDIVFFDRPLSVDETRQFFRAEATETDSELQENLERVHEGKGLKAFDWKPDATRGTKPCHAR